MKSIRSRLTVTFIGLIAVILAVIWGVNKWYLEDFYVTKKVQATPRSRRTGTTGFPSKTP